MSEDKLIISGRAFTSRLIVGTGKYATYAQNAEAERAVKVAEIELKQAELRIKQVELQIREQELALERDQAQWQRSESGMNFMLQREKLSNERQRNAAPRPRAKLTRQYLLVAVCRSRNDLRQLTR